MSEFTNPSSLSRRGFLALGGGAGAAALLAACGGGKSASDAAQGAASPSGTFTAGYNGPAVTLSYWNGFTGGDGPFMKKLVAQFMKENPKITVQSNTIEWAQYYQRLPAAVTAGKGPGVGAMHPHPPATHAAPQGNVPGGDPAKSPGP